MCGIVGMISNKPVCEDMIEALIAQEHRGRDSTGVITTSTNSKGFKSPLRREGSASDLFGRRRGEFDLSQRPDNVAIGHNRYATAGKDLGIDAQPIYGTLPGIALAHNGQIANYVSLREKLENECDYTFFTGCDAELLLDALSVNLRAPNHSLYKRDGGKNQKPESADEEYFVRNRLFPALHETMNPESKYGVVGAYSAIAIIANRGILAFKDPHGVRPLCWALRRGPEKEDIQYVFCSETTALNSIGKFDEFKELDPGEAVFIGFNFEVYAENVYSLQKKCCPFEDVYFAQVDSEFRGQHVSKARYKLGRAIAEEFMHLKDSVDVVTAVPKSPIPTAQAIARAWNKRYEAIVPRPAYSPVRAFQQGDIETRIAQIDKKFIFLKPQIEGQRIGLVDDSVVRGDTSRAVVKKLYDLGAKEVHLFLAFPPFRYTCAGGIDVPDEKKILLHEKSIEEARQYIGATTLNYISLESMLAAVNLTRNTACLGCTLGEYPFDMSDYRRFQEKRVEDRKSINLV